MMKIRLTWKNGDAEAELNQSAAAIKLLEALPCTSICSVWGREVYFEVPANASLEANACSVVDPGTICFWVEGHSVAIPFGPTPISRGNECRLVTEVNILGKCLDDPAVFGTLQEGDEISLERVPI